VLEVFFEFETKAGFGTGVARLVFDDQPHGRLWTLLTRLDELHGHPMPTQRPAGTGFRPARPGENWLDNRRAAMAFTDQDPEVLIVGGGHSGVFAAVYLQRLGVRALVIDRLPRVGDSWRTRYHSLALHNKTDTMHFPGLPFPMNFPQYLPKDRLANWLEFYVDAMDVDFWVSTDFLGATYQPETRTWTARVRANHDSSDSSERTLHPKHIIMATGGVGGLPLVPRIPGIEAFQGQVLHSKLYESGTSFSGQRVLVVGTGTSAHDIALDLHVHGAAATMLQRGSTTIVTLDSTNLAYGQYESARSLDEADLIGAAGFVPDVLKRSFQIVTRAARERDRPLLDRLERAGLSLDFGEDETGWLMKFYERGGGYYIDVGASELVADGTVPILQYDLIDTFVSEGVRLNDGSHLALDAVIFCTGYYNQEVAVRQFFGDDVAERIGPIKGFDEAGELRNAWKPTAQPGLWFMISGIQAARSNAAPMALLIKAELEGLVGQGSPTRGEDVRGLQPQ
jgi:putative flavoprotein involved in K+ transport